MDAFAIDFVSPKLPPNPDESEVLAFFGANVLALLRLAEVSPPVRPPVFESDPVRPNPFCLVSEPPSEKLYGSFLAPPPLLPPREKLYMK